METTINETGSGSSPLLLIKTDKFKTEVLTAAFPLPYENPSSILCSLLFAVLKQGCRKYPNPAEINRRLDDLYDSTVGTMYSPTGENAAAGVIAECIEPLYVPDGTKVLEGTLDMIRDMLTDPLLDADGNFCRDIVENEKKTLCDQLRAADNNPKAHSNRLCNEIMFKGEPYANRILGSVEEISAVTPKTLTKFYREFLHSSVLQFIYIGNRTKEELTPMIESAFGGIGGAPAVLNKTVIKSAPEKIRMIEENMAVTQGKLTVGFRADIPFDSQDIIPALVFNDVFGGSPSSKLFRNVREKQSLCYSCSSTYDFSKGAVFVRSGIANRNKERVTEEILKQFGEIKSGNITDYEFGCSKKSLVSYYEQANDSTYALENYYRQRMMYGIKTTLEETVKKLAAVTKEDVIRVAARFAPDTCAFVRGTLDGDGNSDGNCEEDRSDE